MEHLLHTWDSGTKAHNTRSLLSVTLRDSSSQGHLLEPLVAHLENLVLYNVSLLPKRQNMFPFNKNGMVHVILCQVELILNYPRSFSSIFIKRVSFTLVLFFFFCLMMGPGRIRSKVSTCVNICAVCLLTQTNYNSHRMILFV